MRLIDFSAQKIAPEDIKAAGYDGVVAYVSGSRPGANFGAKPITREYADALRAEGLHIVSNFQYGKPGGTAPSDFTRGFDGGMADARTALRLHEAAGGPDAAPIIFSIDDDIDLDTWNSVGVDWFRGINSTLGVERTGIYGHSRVCSWAIQDGVIGQSTSPGRRWAWQTKAWSHGQREPSAVLFQNVIDTASNPGPLVGGTRVDVNEVLTRDFGQWDLDRSPRLRLAPPFFDESTEIRSPYRGSRRGTDVLWFVLHTEDGNSPSARHLAQYLSNNDRQVSYHYTVDNDGHVYNIVDTKFYANSVLQPGNSKSINLAFAGSWASWSRQTWFERMQHGIDVAAYIAVRDARRYGLQTRVISPEEARNGITGITDHNGVRIATGVGTHTDVGAGFDWEYFRQKVSEYAALAPAESAPRSETPYPGLPIAQGATGRHVAMIQERLNTVADAGLLVDGECAPFTSRAIAAFQRSHGLIADGEVGSHTWAELFADPGPIPHAMDGQTTSAATDSADRYPAFAGSCSGQQDGPAELAESRSVPMATTLPVTGDPVWLEDVLRPALGNRLRTLPGWKDSGVGGTMGRIWGIIWHHTGNARETAQSIRNGRPDLQGPLAQLHIGPDGIVTIVAVGPCNHAGRGSWAGIGTDNANAVTIGVECAWPFDTSITENTQTRERWPDAQIISMRDVGAAITKHLGVGVDHNISHEEWAKFGPAGSRQDKWDPGNIDMNWFRGEIAKDMRGEFDLKPPIPPQTPDYVKAIWDQLCIEWPQLGGQTLVNAVAEIRDKVFGTNDSDKR
jgi:N-acetyl-anhydromuramyl-L-alanine amidase AmpD